ncbi:hypothetical protein K1W54_17910 [Micromonospora sp. CPCC 205371]|nr:hypothetical protein [Micromonospora sp. CPCC 205371]
MLTAAHATADAVLLRLRFDAGRSTERTVEAAVLWRCADHDLAILIFEPAPDDQVASVRYGRMSDRHAVIGVHAAGFPRWKARTRPDGRQFRDLHVADGTLAVLSNRRSGSLEVTVAPPREDPDPDVSPWQAMSGAALWAGNRVIGLIVEHHRAEGLNRLTACRIDRCIEGAATKRNELIRWLGIADAANIVDVVPTPPAQRTLSGYAAQVGDIAPARGLLDRETELDELAAFCAGDEPYVWWQADPWAGKSALMSTFVLNPPAGVDVVSFFVTGRLASQSDSDAFTEALLDQLHALLGEDPLPQLSLAGRDPHRRDLLGKAAERARADGRRLVLVVDGLDEDTGTAPEVRRASIAKLLPKHPAEGLRIILAGRPHPPIPDDVDADHPLRTCRIRRLSPSPHARAIEHDATHQLRQLLNGAQEHVDILGLIAASGGGLSLADLTDLTGIPPFKLSGALHSAFGRTVARRDRGPGRPEAASVYLFAHDKLRETAEQQLGRSLLTTYRDKIHSWADRHHAAGWPADTPAYLLNDYPRTLFTEENLGRLVAYAIDPDRHDRLLEATGGDAAALTEIRWAHTLGLAADDPDLSSIVRLTIQRERLAARNANIPTDLPAVWATLGYLDSAEALAHSIADPARLALALTAIVEATARAGAYEEAATVASSIAGTSRAAYALAGVAEVAAHAGAYDVAETVIARVVDPIRRAWTLANLVELAGTAGHHDDAARFCELLLDADADPPPTAALVAAVRAIAETRDLDRAAALAIGLDDPAVQGAALAATVEVALDRADLARAAAFATRIPDPRARAWTITPVAQAIAATGDHDRATELAHGIEIPGLRSWVLNLLATASGTAREAAPPPAPSRGGACGSPESAHPSPTLVPTPTVEATEPRPEPPLDPARPKTTQPEPLPLPEPQPAGPAPTTNPAVERVRAAIETGDHGTAETTLGEIDDPVAHAQAAASLAASVATTQDMDSAVRILDSIQDPIRRGWALTSTAGALAAAGRDHDAAALVGLIDDASRRAYAIGLVVRKLSAAGFHAEAGGFARDAAGQIGASLNPRPPAWAPSALADALDRVGNASRAARVVGQIVDPVLRAQAAARLAESFIGAGHVYEASAIADMIPEPAPRAELLIALARAAAARGDPDHARDLASAAATAARSVTAPDPQARIIGILAGWALDTGSAAEAIAHLWAIDDRNRRARTLLVLLDQIVDAGLTDAAAAMARSLAPAGTTQAFSTLAEAAASRGDHDRAAAFAREIPDPQQQAATSVALVYTLTKAGEHDRAAAVARTIIDRTEQSRVLSQLAREATAAGDYDRAMALGRDVVDEVGQAIVLTGLFDAFLASGDHERAAVTAHAISDRAGRGSALFRLVETMVAARGLERAATVARDIPDAGRQSLALTAVLEAAIREGDHGLALRMPALIADPSQRAEALTTLAGAMASAGSHDEAAVLAVEAAGAARAIQNTSWRQDALTAVLASLIANGDRDQARVVCRALDDPEQRWWAQAILVEATAEAGDLANAETLADEIADPQHRSAALIALAEAAVRAGEHALALTVAGRVDTAADRALALTALAEAANRAAQGDLAVRACGLARALVHELADADRRLVTLVLIARCLAAAGASEAAVEMADEIVKCAREAPPVLPSVPDRRDVADAARRLVRRTGTAIRLARLRETLGSTGIPSIAATSPSVLAGLSTAAPDVLDAAFGEPSRWARQLATGASGVLPSRRSTQGRIDWGITALAHALASAGDVKRAVMVTRVLGAHAPAPALLAALAEDAARTGRSGDGHALGAGGKRPHKAPLPEGVTAAVRAGNEALAADLLRRTSLRYDRPMILRMIAATASDAREVAFVLAQAPDVRAGVLPAAVRSLARTGEHELAGHVVTDRSDLDRIGLAALVGIGAGTDLVETAVGSLLHLDPANRPERLAGLLVDLAESGGYERAGDLTGMITNPVHQAAARVFVARSAAEVGRVDLVLDLAAGVDDPGLVADILGFLTSRNTDAHQIDRAMALLTRAASIARELSDRTERSQLLATMVQVMTGLGRIDEALALAPEIVTVVQRLRALTGLAAALAAAGRLPEALALVQREAVPTQRAAAFSSAARSVAALGRGREALALAEAIDDGEQRTSALIFVVEEMSRAGHHAEVAGPSRAASAAAENIEDANRQVWAMSALARAALASGDAEEAAALLDKIADPHARASTLASVLRDTPPTSPLAGKTPSANAVADTPLSMSLASGLAEAAGVAGDYERAEALADQIADRARRDEVLRRLARQAAVAGHPGEAASVARAIGADDGSGPLADLVEGLAHAGSLDAAVAVTPEIVDPVEHGRAVAVLVSAFVAAGAYQKAIDLTRVITSQRWRIRAVNSLTERRECPPEASGAIRRLVAEALAGECWPEALMALERVDSDVFRHLPGLLLREE